MSFVRFVFTKLIALSLGIGIFISSLNPLLLIGSIAIWSFINFDVSNIESFEANEFPSWQFIKLIYKRINAVIFKALKNYFVSRESHVKKLL